MESLLQNFITAVRKETSILDDLAQVGCEKKQYIIRNQFQELDTLVQKEGIVVSGLQRAEDARFKLQRELARIWEISPEELTATVLIARLNQEKSSLAGEAEQVMRELNKTAKQLQAINRENQELTNYALDYLDYLLASVQGDVAGIYSENGREAEERPLRPARQLLDRTV